MVIRYSCRKENRSGQSIFPVKETNASGKPDLNTKEKIMNEENTKLQKVVKSCKAAKIVSTILFFAAMVGCTISLITGIVMIANHENFDEQMNRAVAEGKVITQPGGGFKLNVGPFQVAEIDKPVVSESGHPLSDNLNSDIPALQQFIDKNGDSYSVLYGFYLLFISFMIAVLTVAMSLLRSVFDIILKEGNPFADKVVKRILVSMIFVSVVLAFTAGIGFGVLGGFLSWVIYTILDYGRSLKTLSDETL